MGGNGSSGNNGQGHGQNESADYPQSLYIGLYVIGVPLGVVIIVGNVLLMIVLKMSYTKQQKAFKSKTAVVIGNLAVYDTLGGFILIINVGLYSLYDVIGQTSPIGCYIWNIMSMIPLLGGFLNLIFLAVERYVIVNQIPNYPHMKRLQMFIGLVWSYDVIMGLLALAFLNTVRPDAYVMCDVLTLSPIYVTVIIFVHVVICIIVCTAFIFVIKSTVKHHQCKIQVSNTITYNNLIDDARVAKVFYVVTMVAFLFWLPFLICEIVLVAGVESRELLIASRWAFLCGHLGYLKCFWLMIGSPPLWQDYKRVFVKQKKRPFRMGTIVREG